MAIKILSIQHTLFVMCDRDHPIAEMHPLTTRAVPLAKLVAQPTQLQVVQLHSPAPGRFYFLFASSGIHIQIALKLSRDTYSCYILAKHP